VDTLREDLRIFVTSFVTSVKWLPSIVIDNRSILACDIRDVELRKVKTAFVIFQIYLLRLEI
jgi:hypothetical protein